MRVINCKAVTSPNRVRSCSAQRRAVHEPREKLLGTEESRAPSRRDPELEATHTLARDTAVLWSQVHVYT